MPPRNRARLPRGIRLRSDWNKGRVSKQKAYGKCIRACTEHASCVAVWWRTRPARLE